MTLIQINCILAVLMAFGVDTSTLTKVHDILIPPVAIVGTTTPSIQTPFVPTPVVQTPIVPNQPIQFGSVAPAPVAVTCDNTPVITVTPFVHVNGKDTILPTPVILQGEGTFDYDSTHIVWLATSAKSKCDSKWTISQTGTRGVATQNGTPSDDYPVGSSEFFDSNHVNMNINANKIGTYVSTITATDGTTTATTTFTVLTN